MCTCTGKSPILEAGLLGSSALGRLPFISRAVASICGDALSGAGAPHHDRGAPRPRPSKPGWGTQNRGELSVWQKCAVERGA